MFKVWINKKVDEKPGDREYIVFNLFNKNKESNIKVDVENLWRRFGEESINDISEDLLIIAMSVFAVDKRISRNLFKDNWTREVVLDIPVLELEKWNIVKQELEAVLSFLSGDRWKFNFRKTELKFRADKKNTKYRMMNKKNFNSVSLFSGGLDSFCGALNLLEKNKQTCFIGFREYNLLTNRQNELFSALNFAYPAVNKELLLFNASPLAPVDISGNKMKIKGESTSRSRSFLFLAGAVVVASIIGEETPIYIPENGFIGINVPLTDSRNGSCSTRTTHPRFLKSLNSILRKIGLNHSIENFYWNKTKGEIVEEHKENEVFKEYAHKTLSCSHPCLCRYDKIKPPCNCGYCYPCLIRRASMIKAGDDETVYNEKHMLNRAFIDTYNKPQGKASDLKAVLFSIKRYLKHQEDSKFIRNLLLRPGNLTMEELVEYERVYRESMKELLSMIEKIDKENGSNLLGYIGIEEKIGCQN
ncbi:hypothetical protein P4388_21120 [Bacillus thuringiensis]|uniref:Qat anti-phage system QueC-like protein QatC n=1 Tax=Bacillus cereus group TaxID=86661 RepID=UPI000A39F747|nr:MULTISPECIES: Qat anti-phage system QueC-like protein QatC [Bacillus cereus group]MED3351100.1 hypothetical protein [Bacillus thuringiensis]MRB10395.1 hypothetical protein [Bacillus thuringiensis]OTW92743.1 hypothetical protein BK711_25625 [Bacillus thuringiensis serovar fukuokaensis]TKH60187.1 hypothetical protein FC679_19995 [Bacillus cereus]